MLEREVFVVSPSYLASDELIHALSSLAYVQLWKALYWPLIQKWTTNFSQSPTRLCRRNVPCSLPNLLGKKQSRIGFPRFPLFCCNTYSTSDGEVSWLPHNSKRVKVHDRGYFQLFSESRIPSSCLNTLFLCSQYFFYPVKCNSFFVKSRLPIWILF